MVDKTVIDDRFRCKEVAKTSITQTWSHLILWQKSQSKLYTDRNWMIANSNITTVTSHVGNIVALHRDISIVCKRLQRSYLNPLWLQVSIHTIRTSNLCNHWEILTLSQEERRYIKKNTTSLLVSCLDRETIEVKVTIVRSLCLLRITCW